MKFIKRIYRLLQSIAVLMGGSLPPSSSAKAFNAAQTADETADHLKRHLAGTGRRRDDITFRSLCRTINQRKRRNLMRWARANGSAA